MLLGRRAACRILDGSTVHGMFLAARSRSRKPRALALARAVHHPRPVLGFLRNPWSVGAFLALALALPAVDASANGLPGHVAIGVGTMADRTPSGGAALGPRLREAILAELRAARVPIVPARAVTARGRAARRSSSTRYFLEGAVSDVRTQRVGRGLRVRCTISLMVLDHDREVRMVLSSAASAELSRAVPGSEVRLSSQALEGAVHGVFGRLLRSLSVVAAARPARRS